MYLKYLIVAMNKQKQIKNIAVVTNIDYTVQIRITKSVFRARTPD